MTRKKQRQNRTRANALLRELRDYEREGTHLYLEDAPSRADEIVRTCLCAEESDYMRDIISDDDNRITEIHFIRVSEESKL